MTTNDVAGVSEVAAFNAPFEQWHLRRTNSGGDNVHFKILIPSVAAGAVIGKGGDAIAKIQKETGAKIKMSKSCDFYPGTMERVCLIHGSVEAILKVHDYIMEKIHEKPEGFVNNVAAGWNLHKLSSSSLDLLMGKAENRAFTERHKQVKILVPNSTAGMIIGKGGQFIKEIKEASCARVQISQKSKDVNVSLPERCVIITGELEHNKQAVHMILLKIAEDPQSSTCPNISYADFNRPLPSAFPTGSPFAVTNTSASSRIHNFSATSCASSSYYSNNMSFTDGRGAYAAAVGRGRHGGGGGEGSQSNGFSAFMNKSSSQNNDFFIHNFSLNEMRSILKNGDFDKQAIESIENAMQVLTSYGLINDYDFQFGDHFHGMNSVCGNGVLLKEVYTSSSHPKMMNPTSSTPVLSAMCSTTNRHRDQSDVCCVSCMNPQTLIGESSLAGNCSFPVPLSLLPSCPMSITNDDYYSPDNQHNICITEQDMGFPLSGEMYSMDSPFSPNQLVNLFTPPIPSTSSSVTVPTSVTHQPTLLCGANLTEICAEGGASAVGVGDGENGSIMAHIPYDSSVIPHAHSSNWSEALVDASNNSDFSSSAAFYGPHLKHQKLTLRQLPSTNVVDHVQNNLNCRVSITAKNTNASMKEIELILSASSGSLVMEAKQLLEKEAFNPFVHSRDQLDEIQQFPTVGQQPLLVGGGIHKSPQLSTNGSVITRNHSCS